MGFHPAAAVETPDYFESVALDASGVGSVTLSRTPVNVDRVHIIAWRNASVPYYCRVQSLVGTTLTFAVVQSTTGTRPCDGAGHPGACNVQAPYQPAANEPSMRICVVYDS